MNELLAGYNETIKELFDARQKIKELEKEIERLKAELENIETEVL